MVTPATGGGPLESRFRRKRRNGRRKQCTGDPDRRVRPGREGDRRARRLAARHTAGSSDGARDGGTHRRRVPRVQEAARRARPSLCAVLDPAADRLPLHQRIPPARRHDPLARACRPRGPRGAGDLAVRRVGELLLLRADRGRPVHDRRFAARPARGRPREAAGVARLLRRSDHVGGRPAARHAVPLRPPAARPRTAERCAARAGLARDRVARLARAGRRAGGQPVMRRPPGRRRRVSAPRPGASAPPCSWL